jgi:hypothetical protein
MARVCLLLIYKSSEDLSESKEDTAETKQHEKKELID